MDDLPLIVVIVVCVILSAFFSASETAYTSVNKIRLKTQAENGDKKSEKVLKTIDKYDRLISTILIGNNIVNITAATCATIVFSRHMSPETSSWVSTLVMTIIVLIVGEVCPKSFAKLHSEGVVRFVNPIIRFLIYIFLPFSWLLEQISRFFNMLFKGKKVDDKFSEDELLTIIDEIEDEGIIKPYEKDLITSAIKFDDIEVKDIVTPRKDIVAIEVTSSVEEIHKVYEESKFTRIPVYRDTIDNIIGILHEKDFYSYLLNNMDKEFKISEIMRPVHFVSQETKISVIFKKFRDEQFHMAVVLDQFDSTLGLIAMEDIVEELVGEIFDETDEIIEETKEVDENHFLVDGREILSDALEIMDIELKDEDEEDPTDLNQTINSWLCSIFGRLPTAGDNLIFQDDWKVMVKTANRKGAISVEFERI